MNYIANTEIHAGAAQAPVVIKAGKLLGEKEVLALGKDLASLVKSGAISEVKPEVKVEAPKAEAPKGKK